MPGTIGYPNEDLSKEAAEDLVRIARSRLEHGKVFRKSRREGRWRQSEMQFSGNHWGVEDSTSDPTADLVVVNISFSTVVTIVPYVTGSDPRFLVEPYSKDATVLNARAQGAWINRFWRTQDSGARPALYDAAHDSIIYGQGWGKVVYSITKNRDDKSIAKLKVDAVSPWDIWIDPSANAYRSARWVAQRIRTTLGELREDGTFDNLDLLARGIAEHADEIEQDRILQVGYDEKDSDYAWVEIYEFYDLVKRRLIVFASDSALPLKVVDDIDCPLRCIENHWLPSQPYRMGDLEQIWELQQELNKSRSQMLTHRRRNITKYLVKSDVLDEGAEQALMSQVVGQMVKIKGNEPLDSVIRPVASSPLSADAYNVSDLITRDVFEITGVNEYLRGATPTIRRTATEASIIEGASNIKSAHKLTKVENFVRDIGTLILNIAADVFPLTDYDELEMFITGRDAEALNKAELAERVMSLAQRGAPQDILQREVEGSDLYGGTNLTPGPDIFRGVYQVEVVANSTELRDPVFKEQKFREMAQVLTEAAPVLAQQGVQLNLRKIYDLWFEAAGIQDTEDLFSPTAPQAPMGVPPASPEGASPPMMPQMLRGLGQPNLQALGAPTDVLTPENTGALPPAG